MILFSSLSPLVLVLAIIFSYIDVNVTGSLPDGHHEDYSQMVMSSGGDFVLPDNYSLLIPPPTPNDEPTKVEFSVVIMNVRDIKESTEEISFEMNLRIFWTDTRLKNLTGADEFLVLNPVTIEKIIWRPDVFIDHVKSIITPALMSKPASMRLFGDGLVRYSERVTVVISCHMNFKYYPADTQRCNVDLKSYAYPNNILILGWHDGVSASLADNLTIPNFSIKLDNTGEFETVSSSGIYSGIRFIISLRRNMSYHLLQTYAISAVFMIVSWLTLLMPQDCGAIVVCMTTLLTMTALFAAVRQNTPTVSYAKAIDIWMVTCVVFVFFCLVQHALTLRLRHMKVLLKKRKRFNERRQVVSTHNQNDDPPVDDDPDVMGVAYRANGRNSFQLKHFPNENENDSPPRDCSMNTINRRYTEPPKTPSPLPPADEEDSTTKAIQEYKVLGNKIRKVFSWATPISFGIFNIIYWPWLMRSSEYFY